jgi:hypothetical protein
MAHRREQKEALRREREKREAEARAAAQRKKLVGYGAAAVIAVVAVVLIVVLAGGGSDGSAQGQGGGDVFPEGADVSEQTEFDLNAAADAAGCELITTEAKSDRDREHVPQDQTVDYQGNPPTLGAHWPPGLQAEDGLYFRSPADEALVHTMEHGRVIIWAKPDLPREEREQLRALFDEDNFQLVLTPRRNMPFAVAATAWNGDPQPRGTGRTLGCEQWSDGVIDALRAFRDEHRSNGPEDVP